MSQDIISDALNVIRNANRAKKKSVKIKRVSNLLLEVVKIMKHKGAIENYKMEGRDNSMEIIIKNLNECRAVKPRFTVKKEQVDKYIRRYLPARGIGTLIISTNKGLMSHEQAVEENIGGCLIAYFY